MKKMSLILSFASLFICCVMIYLVFVGVKPRQQKMVKWSQVKSPQEAGSKISRFFFPILKESQQVVVDGKTEFSQIFFEAFKKEAQSIAPDSQVEMAGASPAGDQFKIMVRFLDQMQLKMDCEKGDYHGCVGLGAFKKFYKKQRDPTTYWIHMARLEKNLAVLFFMEPREAALDQ